jgi:two-component system response regulator YesN
MKGTDGRVIQLKNRLGNCRQVNQIVVEMAQTFNVTTLYLKQIFKQQTGRTILQFDKDLRLEKAKSLLENTFLRVKEVCFEVGFKDCSHFVRDFEQKFGISPKELQKQSWLENCK